MLIVSSVSCIYGLGSPDAFYGMLHFFKRGDATGIEAALRRLAEMQYKRTHLDLYPGSFRVRGDVLEVQPSYDERGIRVEYFGDEIERLQRFDPLTGTALEEMDQVPVYPQTHYVTPRDRMERAIVAIERELDERLVELLRGGQLLEAQRLEQRTRFDLEMLREVGSCQGIENYSRHLTGGVPGEPPPTLLDYLPDDFLLVVDESHQTMPQVRGMYEGDRSRKQTLVDYGFRLPSALDNRPLTVRRVRRQGRPAHLRVGDAGAVGARAHRRRLRRAGDPPHRPARSGDRAASGAEPGRRSAGGGAAGGGARRARAGHHPHQAHGGGAHRSTCASSGSRRATCTATSRRSSGCRSPPRCARASSTSWSGSTCCARGSTCPRCRWSPCSTPTRKASCAARRR